MANKFPFELGVKGKGKSRKEKLALLDASILCASRDEEVFIVDPDNNISLDKKNMR